jgi:hypothetical protein
MNEAQKEFWSRLMAPFPRDSYEERPGPRGKNFTYLRPRAIMNRLDEVAGPHSWDLKFVPSDRGVICSISVMAPDVENGYPIRVERSWCGGPNDDMGTADASYKTACSNAFKACAACFGIGRDLYQEGMPSFISEEFGCPASGIPVFGSQGGPPVKTTEARTPEVDRREGREAFGIQPPWGKHGSKAAYAWGKKMEEMFKFPIVQKMADFAKRNGQPWQVDQWSAEFLQECLTRTVDFIKTLASYGGEFGPAIQKEEPPKVSEEEDAAGIDLMATKSALAAATSALLQRKNGRRPEDGEVIAALGEIASSVADGKGKRGQVMESLRACTDVKWIKNCKAKVEKMIADAAKETTAVPETPVDDIPF